MIPNEFLQDLGFTHAGRPKEQQVWHPVAGRVLQQVSKSFQCQIGAWIRDPAVSQNAANTLCRVEDACARHSVARCSKVSLTPDLERERLRRQIRIGFR
jgi:hypothetical protein